MSVREATRWVEIASTSDIEEEITALVVEGKEIALYRIGEDFYATSNVCTHSYALLSDGWLVEDCKVECPLHAGCFDIRSGKATMEPAEEDLRTFPLRIEGGFIYLDLSE